MCELLAMSTRYAANLTMSLRTLVTHGGGDGAADGWGIAYYEGRDARRIRDTAAAADSAWSSFVEQQGLTSSMVIAHIRMVTLGATALENTQPFYRELGGRAHVFAHNGDFPEILASKRYMSERFRPIGDSDSEYAFCALLERLREPYASVPSFERRWQVFQAFCAELRPMGPANLLYSDGEILFVHANIRTQADGELRPPGLHWLCRECAQEPSADISSAAISVQAGKQVVVLVASVPLTEEPWQPLAEGEMLAIRQGRIVANALPSSPSSTKA